MSFPILFDKDSKVSKLYDVPGMPSTVIIDRDGKVRMLHRGYKPGDENEYLDSIRTLVTGVGDARVTPGSRPHSAAQVARIAAARCCWQRSPAAQPRSPG